MVRRTKTATGRKSPILRARVKSNAAQTFPYLVTITGVAPGDDSFHARKAVLAQIVALGDAGKITGAIEVEVTYRKGPNKAKAAQPAAE